MFDPRTTSGVAVLLHTSSMCSVRSGWIAPAAWSSVAATCTSIRSLALTPQATSTGDHMVQTPSTPPLRASSRPTHPGTLNFVSVAANNSGSIELLLDAGYVRRLFPNGSRVEEFWRYFQPDTSGEDVVVFNDLE